jgi:hypothetical protein
MSIIAKVPHKGCGRFLRATADNLVARDDGSGSAASPGSEPEWLTDHAVLVDALHRESPVGLENERRRLAQISARFIEVWPCVLAPGSSSMNAI